MHPEINNRYSADYLAPTVDQSIIGAAVVPTVSRSLDSHTAYLVLLLECKSVIRKVST